MPDLNRTTVRHVVAALAGLLLSAGTVAVAPPAFAYEGRGEHADRGYHRYDRYDRFTDPYRYEPSDQACYPAVGGVYLGQTYDDADYGVYLADFFPAN